MSRALAIESELDSIPLKLRLVALVPKRAAAAKVAKTAPDLFGLKFNFPDF